MEDTNAVRILTDGRGKRTEFDEFQIGAPFDPYELVLTPEQIDYFCEGHQEYHEWYTVDSPFGGRICPPVMGYRIARDMFSNKFNVRGLLVEYETENFNPMLPGKKLRCTGGISGKWVKRDREFVEYTVTCTDEEGLEIFRTRRVHVLDVLKRDTPREGVNEKTFNKL